MRTRRVLLVLGLLVAGGALAGCADEAPPVSAAPLRLSRDLRQPTAIAQALNAYPHTVTLTPINGRGPADLEQIAIGPGGELDARYRGAGDVRVAYRLQATGSALHVEVPGSKLPEIAAQGSSWFARTTPITPVPGDRAAQVLALVVGAESWADFSLTKTITGYELRDDTAGVGIAVRVGVEDVFDQLTITRGGDVYEWLVSYIADYRWADPVLPASVVPQSYDRYQPFDWVTASS